MAALLLALGFHAALLGVILFLSLVEVNFPRAKLERPARPSAVSMRPIAASQWAQNRGEVSPQEQLAAREAPAAPPKKAKEIEPPPRGQVVDVAPGNGEEDPNAQHLAESSNKTQKESRAKDQTAFYRNAMPRRTTTTPQQGAGHDAVDKPQVSGNLGAGNDDRPVRDANQGKAALEIPDIERQSEVALRQPEGPGPGQPIQNREESEAMEGNSTRLRVRKGGESGEETPSSGRPGQPGVANLLPSLSVVDKISGAAANDHLRDVPEGEGTYLNTKEWKYASFFNRVKQSVSMQWNPANQLRQRDPSGTIYGGRDRYTLLNVTLNEQGMVKDIYVEKSSGVDFLDLEAIRSFERAQPFPNPPPGLVAQDAQVRFSFGFFLEMGGPRMRLFRQAN